MSVTHREIRLWHNHGGLPQLQTVVECARCTMRRDKDALVTEDDPESAYCGRLVCQKCYDGKPENPPWL